MVSHCVRAIVIMMMFLSMNCRAGAQTVCSLVDKQTGKTFRIFNALLYSNLPDMGGLCIEKIYVSYAWNYFPRGTKYGDLKMPSKNDIDTAISTARRENTVTVIDIEHWPLKNSSFTTVKQSVTNYLTVLEAMTTALPDITIGYYGVVPITDFKRARLAKDTWQYQEWVAENNRVQRVADLVGATFPSLYTIDPKQDRWRARARAQIAEARRLSPGKPVYPFIWPNYHEQGGKYPVGTEVEAGYWRMQLEYLRQHANGIVLWGGNRQTFNDHMAWWRETVAFINSAFNKNVGTEPLPPPAPSKQKVHYKH